jgi:hydroxyacylglutathione hydrolase
VYCGHEYTVKNLQFSQTVEPDNDSVTKKLEWAKDCRARESPTVPSSIGTGNFAILIIFN